MFEVIFFAFKKFSFETVFIFKSKLDSSKKLKLVSNSDSKNK